METSDSELLRAWHNGDKRAGGQLFNRHFRAIHRFFASKIGPAYAEELSQQTFVAAVESKGRYSGQASVRSWLFGIARNILRQWFEKRGRARRREQDIGEVSIIDLGMGPRTAVELRHEQQLLVTALQRLAMDSQILLELVYWEKLKGRELAAVFGVPEGTIRGRIRKAKAELRAILDELNRTGIDHDTTIQGLETWAGELRAAWAR